MSQIQKKTDAQPIAALTQYMKELSSTGEFSDLTIKCGDQELRVHKTYVCPHSSWFRAALAGKFKEESHDHNILTLDHDEPEVIKARIHYCYHLTYNNGSRGEEAAATFAVKVYAAADKYNMLPLCKMAASNFSKVLDPNQDLDGFIAAIEAVDEMTGDDALWDLVMPKVAENAEWLSDVEEFSSLVRESPTLRKKLIKCAGKGGPSSPQISNDGGYAGGYGSGGRTLGS
ncbi:hypothetical protein LTR97_001172 [Elasticomyces elasticus]|uniref:BTB domain-containing protein n=1 Tax=Elasticomyces elasticus TaxID=574655 RepID=A0AAN7VWP8_9PEZI|nr:hypothetical protein LTR97_001172 [Elasticomyces elasticus]